MGPVNDVLDELGIPNPMTVVTSAHFLIHPVVDLAHDLSCTLYCAYGNSATEVIESILVRRANANYCHEIDNGRMAYGKL